MSDIAGYYCDRDSKGLIPLKLAMIVNNVLYGFRLVRYLRYPSNILLDSGWKIEENMYFKNGLLVLLLSLFSLNVLGTEVLDGRTGKPYTGKMTEPRGAFSIDPSIIGGEKAVFTQIEKSPVSSESFVWNTSRELFAIAVTKIRDDYRKDSGLLKEKVYPSSLELKKLGKENFSIEWEGKDKKLVLKETNQLFEFGGLDDLVYLVNSNIFGLTGGFIRVDRHFVSRGYYIQVITVIPIHSDEKKAINRANALSNMVLDKTRI